jgi:hypothetical protein
MVAGRWLRATNCEVRVTTGSEYALVKGYGGASPGFPVDLVGVDELHAAFFDESRVKFANASKFDRKSGVRFGERGAPVLFPSGWFLGRGFGVHGGGIPHLAKNKRDMGHPG